VCLLFSLFSLKAEGKWPPRTPRSDRRRRRSADLGGGNQRRATYTAGPVPRQNQGSSNPHPHINQQPQHPHQHGGNGNHARSSSNPNANNSNANSSNANNSNANNANANNSNANSSNANNSNANANNSNANNANAQGGGEISRLLGQFSAPTERADTDFGRPSATDSNDGGGPGNAASPLERSFGDARPHKPRPGGVVVPARHSLEGQVVRLSQEPPVVPYGSQGRAPMVRDPMVSYGSHSSNRVAPGGAAAARGAAPIAW
jgi:hypothetical protein